MKEFISTIVQNEWFLFISGVCSIIGLCVAVFAAYKVINIQNSINIKNKSMNIKNQNIKADNNGVAAGRDINA